MDSSIIDIRNIHIPNNIKHIKIDVGLGEYNINSVNWLKYEKDLFVIMFDPNGMNTNPVTRAIHKIEQDDTMNESNMVHVIPVALANLEQPTNLTFYKMQKDTGTSSLFQPIDRNLGPIQTTEIVPAYSLKHFFDIFPWHRFDYIEYIKIDAQGADLDIIKSAGSYLSEKVVFITAEPESNQYMNCGHNTPSNMEEYLTSQNFTRIYHPRTRDPTFINNKFVHLKDNIYLYQI